MPYLRRFFSILACLAFIAPAAAVAAKTACPSSRLPPLLLPHLRQALRQNQEATIVALGSSSTAGFHASNIAHSYPAVLQRELEKALPLAHVAVINRGVGGEDATEMVPRIERDVLALSPTVVIWQVGANGVMRNMDPDYFKTLVTSGVERMRAAGVDVVLMGNQRAPAILASPHHERIDEVLAEVAGLHGAGLFARGRLMDQWQAAGFPYAQFVSDDGVHHNDRGYACVAKALAASILDGLGPDPGAMQAAASR